MLATATPDNTFPATATKVQAQLGMTRGAAFDVQAVCSGFIYRARRRRQLHPRLGQARTALVIGAETFSRILDWEDRGTCVLFGDGAGAVVLKRACPDGGTRDRGILSTHLHSDGRAVRHPLCRWRPVLDAAPPASCGWRAARCSATPCSTWPRSSTRRWRANGLDRRRHRLAGAAPGQQPHHRRDRPQARPAADKVVVTIERHANTSAASIPLALAEAVGDGRIKPGHWC